MHGRTAPRRYWLQNAGFREEPLLGCDEDGMATTDIQIHAVSDLTLALTLVVNNAISRIGHGHHAAVIINSTYTAR